MVVLLVGGQLEGQECDLLEVNLTTTSLLIATFDNNRPSTIKISRFLSIHFCFNKRPRLRSK
jgi:hypothetical protein